MKPTWAKYVSKEEKDTMPSDMKLAMFTTISAKTALINKELAKIGKLAGIDKKISFHISRHSFAKMAKEKGLDNLEVKALLAHTNISTTQKYMGEFDTQRDDAALGKVFKKDNDAEKLLKQLQGVNPELLKEVLERLAKEPTPFIRAKKHKNLYAGGNSKDRRQWRIRKLQYRMD